MNIVLYILLITFIIIGIVFYKYRQDYFDGIVSICMVISGVILFSIHLVLQVFL
ncbi:hypothetical protein [Staphylococcus phage Stab22]|nr:hypothetical protein [Staphylococcus phage Stab22]